PAPRPLAEASPPPVPPTKPPATPRRPPAPQPPPPFPPHPSRTLRAGPERRRPPPRSTDVTCPIFSPSARCAHKEDSLADTTLRPSTLFRGAGDVRQFFA